MGEATAATPLAGLAIALGTGLLIGLQRGWAQRERAPGQRLAGLRTFALIGLLGGLCGLLSATLGAAPVVAGLLAVAAAMLMGWRETVRQEGNLSLTSAVAALVTFVLGALATLGQAQVAAAAAVVTAALLQLKPVLHASLARLTELELRSGLQLGLISLVVLPVLPDRGFGPWQVLNPAELWWSVVLLAVLSFAGFVLMRWAGPRRGIAVTALLGGLVSSTATTATLARWTREAPGLAGLAAGGVVLACAAMFARMAVLVAVVAPGFGAAALAALMAMAVTGACWGLWQVRSHPMPVDTDRPAAAPPATAGAAAGPAGGGDAVSAGAGGAATAPALAVANPLRLRLALQFALFLAGVLLAGRFLAERFGEAGLIASAAVAGLVDVDAITLTVSRLARDGVVADRSATWALFVAAAVNQLTKLGLAAWLAGPRGVLPLLLPFGLMAAAGAAVAVAW